MLRALILALLVANAAFFAWTQGWLDAVVGTRSIGDREPERLLRQVRPETIRILPPEATSAPAAAEVTPAPSACLEAGPFADAEIAAAQAAAQAALPPGSWATVKTEQPGTWLVYMGRYASREALTKKEDEIKRRKLPYEEIGAPPALAPGLSLGRFEQRPAAVQALEQFTAQGVRTARVVELTPASTRHVLRVDKADAALATKLAALKPEAIGKPFTACARPAGA
jgi:hypothetical protein